VANRPTILRTPDNVSAALTQAEAELQQPPSGKTEVVHLRPADIKTRPELFQPRGFYTCGGLDPDHVAKLTRRIGAKGELDPPLVVKLTRDWICVDGHHRIEAYQKQPGGGWPGTISCHWFAGSVRNAVDESVRRNDIAKLEIRRGDKYEAAWQRVVLGWGSKREIRLITGVSDGLVGMMRRVVESHKAQDDAGRDFRARLRSIKDATWSAARSAYLQLSTADYDEEEEARKLAGNLLNRMHGKLSENKRVTALALALYDPALPGPLASELHRAISEIEQHDQGTEDNLTANLVEELTRLRADRERMAKRFGELERKLKERGVNPDTLTPSDATWEHWVAEVARDMEAADEPTRQTGE
jgi:hypothetical protein